jgi:hypothetical protein
MVAIRERERERENERMNEYENSCPGWLSLFSPFIPSRPPAYGIWDVPPTVGVGLFPP